MIFISLFLWAQDDTDDFLSDIWEPEDVEMEEYETEPPPPKKFRLKNRTVEFSIANISVDISNSFIAAADIFRNPFYLLWNINDIIKDPVLIYQDKIVIDLDDFFNGFKFNFGAVVMPFSLNFNRHDKWGFGLDIGHVSVMGNVFLSGNMMRLKKIKDDKFGVGAAVFADVGIPVFFHVNELKIKMRPAAYVPILYAEPNVIYTGKNVKEGTYLKIDYNMRIYSLVDLNDGILKGLQDNAWDIPRNNMGYDFRLGMEYPLDYGLDLGVDIVNIPVPFAAAKLNHYSQINGKAVLDTSSIDLADLTNDGMNMEDVFDYNYEYKSGYDSKGKNIYRPFVMLFYANYRPFDTRVFSLIPSLGFSINWLYPQIFSLEGGLSACFDFANIFILVPGINYNDHQWKNSIDFVLNLRAFELDFGLSMQSQDFIKSFRGAGLGVNFGLKFGW
jgi:hypothetical protein